MRKLPTIYLSVTFFIWLIGFSSNAQDWIYSQRFNGQTATFSSGVSTQFGASVVVHGDFVVVGDPGARAFDANGALTVQRAGRVYIYKRERNLWFEPTPGNFANGQFNANQESPSGSQRLIQVIESPLASEGGQFGSSVSFNGDLLVVGAPGEYVPSRAPEIGNDMAGATLLGESLGSLVGAGIFSRTFGGFSDALLNRVGKMQMAVDYSTFAIEELKDKVFDVVQEPTQATLLSLQPGNVRAGAAWVFKRADPQDRWVLVERLQEGPEGLFGGESVPAFDEEFGAAVALSPDGERIAVGIPNNRDANYLNAQAGFRLYAGYAALSPVLGNAVAAASAIAEMIIAAAEPVRKGRVVIYGWNEQHGRWIRETGRSALRFSSDGYFDRFGESLAWSPDGQALAVGAPWAARTGRVHVFTKSDDPVSSDAQNNVVEPDPEFLTEAAPLIFQREIGQITQGQLELLLAALAETYPQPVSNAWRHLNREEIIPDYGPNYTPTWKFGSPVKGFGKGLAWTPDGHLIIGDPRDNKITEWRRSPPSQLFSRHAYVFVGGVSGLTGNPWGIGNSLLIPGFGPEAGSSLAVSRDGRTVFAGAPGFRADNVPPAQQTNQVGTVLSLPRLPGGDLTRREAFNTFPHGRFGESVAVSALGDLMVASAPVEGYAYVYQLYVRTTIDTTPSFAEHTVLYDAKGERVLFFDYARRDQFPRLPTWLDPWFNDVREFPANNDFRFSVMLPAYQTFTWRGNSTRGGGTFATGGNDQTFSFSTPTYTFGGRLYSAGRPVSGAVVNVLGPRLKGAGSDFFAWPNLPDAVSDAEGRFTFSNVALPDFNYFRLSIYNTNHFFDAYGNNEIIDVIATSVPPLQLIFHAYTARVTGRVETGAGLNPATLTVELRSGTNVVASTNLNAAGRYAFRDVERGAYRVVLLDPAVGERSVEVNVPVPAHPGIEFAAPTIRITYPLSGKLTSGGQLYPFMVALEVQELDIEPPPAPVMLYPRRSYDVSLPPGRYRVRVVETIDPPLFNFAPGEGVREVSHLGPTTGVDFDFAPGDLTGRVVTRPPNVPTPDTYDFTGSIVQLMPLYGDFANFHNLLSAPVAADGSYTFRDLQPGNYMVILPGEGNFTGASSGSEFKNPWPNTFLPVRPSPLGTLSQILTDIPFDPYDRSLYHFTHPARRLRNEISALEQNLVRSRATKTAFDVMAEIYPVRMRAYQFGGTNEPTVVPSETGLLYRTPHPFTNGFLRRVSTTDSNGYLTLWHNTVEHRDYALLHRLIDRDAVVAPYLLTPEGGFDVANTYNLYWPPLRDIFAPVILITNFAGGTSYNIFGGALYGARWLNAITPEPPPGDLAPSLQLDPRIVTGRVVSATSPAAGLPGVVIDAPWLTTTTVVTDANGFFTGALPPTFAELVPQAGLLGTEPARHILDPARPGEMILFRAFTAPVMGRVTLHGQPAPGVRVVNGNGREAVTDANGEYIMPDLTGPDETLSIDPAHGEGVPASRTITLTGSAITGVDFELRTSTLTGTLARADGGAFPPGMVIRFERMGDAAPAYSGTVVAGADGSFSVSGLPLGDYRVWIDDARLGGLPAAQTITLGAGGDAVLHFQTIGPVIANSAGHLWFAPRPENEYPRVAATMPDLISGATQMTFEVWVAPVPATGNRFTPGIPPQPILTWSTAARTQDGSNVPLPRDDVDEFRLDLTGDGRPRFYSFAHFDYGTIQGLAVARDVVAPFAIPRDGRAWTHLAVTLTPGGEHLFSESYSLLMPMMQATIFVNGRAVASGLVPAPRRTPYPYGYIGRDVRLMADGSNEVSRFAAFVGGMDSIRVWHKALTPAELETSMFTNPPAGTRGLVAQYLLDEGQGGPLIDSSGNGLAGWLADPSTAQRRRSFAATIDEGGEATLYPRIITLGTTPATMEIVTPPSAGSAQANFDGSLRFVAPPGVGGPFTFTARAAVGAITGSATNFAINVNEGPMGALVRPHGESGTPSLGETIGIEVRLNNTQVAPPSGYLYQLSVFPTNLFEVPPLVMIGGGFNMASFPLFSRPGTSNATAFVTATRGTRTISHSVTFAASVAPEVAGRIVTSGGTTPISGVTVRLGDRETVTGSDGRYVFTDVPYGTYAITYDMPAGFEHLDLPGSVAVSGNTTIGDAAAFSPAKLMPMGRFLRISSDDNGIDLSPLPWEHLFNATPPRSGFSLETWVRYAPGMAIDPVFHGMPRTLFSLDSSTQSQARVALAVDPATRELIFQTATNGIVRGGMVPSDRWAHVAATVTYDATNAAVALVRLFVQGREVAVTNLPVPAPGPRDLATLGFAPRTNGIAPFRGDLDAARVWARPLTPGELYDRIDTYAPANRASLVAEYLLDEVKGYAVRDSSGGGLHTVLRNGRGDARIQSSLIEAVNNAPAGYSLGIASRDFRLRSIRLDITQPDRIYSTSGIFTHPDGTGSFSDMFPPGTTPIVAALLDGEGNDIPGSSITIQFTSLRNGIASFAFDTPRIRYSFAGTATARIRLTEPLVSNGGAMLSREDGQSIPEPWAPISDGNSEGAWTVPLMPTSGSATAMMYRASVFGAGDALTTLEILPNPETILLPVTRRGTNFGPVTAQITSDDPAQPELVVTASGIIANNLTPGHTYTITPQHTKTTFDPPSRVITLAATDTLGVGAFNVVEPVLTGLAVPNALAGGTTGELTITLDRVAPPGGASVALFSDSPSLILPPEVVIPNGHSQTVVFVSAAVVTSNTSAEVAAVLDDAVLVGTVALAPELSVVAGRVFFGGQAISGITVRVTGPGGTDVTVITDAFGQYRVNVVEQGTYTVQVSGIVAFDDDTLLVEVGEEAAPPADFNAPQPAPVSLIVDTTNVTITLDRAAPSVGWPFSVTIQPTNALVAPTQVIIPAGSNVATFVVTPGTPLGPANALLTLTSTNGSIVTNIFVPGTPIELSGRLTDAEGESLAGLEVLLNGADTAAREVTTNAVSGADGRYAFIADEGFYSVTPFSPTNTRFTVPSRPVLTSGSSITNLDFQLVMPRLQSLSFGGVAEVRSESTITGTLRLDALAPTSGLEVQLASTNPAVTIPASVTVTGGATRVSFVLETGPVIDPVPATITATLGTNTVSDTFLIVPPNDARGMVTHRGQPVSGAEIEVTYGLFPWTVLVITSSVDGAWTSGDLPRGFNALARAYFDGERFGGQHSFITSFRAVTNLNFGLPAPQIASVVLPPLTPYQTTTGIVELAEALRPGFGDLTVVLSSDSSEVTVPASVIFTGGQQTASFMIDTTLPEEPLTVTITADAEGHVRSGVTSLTPPARLLVAEVLDELGQPRPNVLVSFQRLSDNQIRNVPTGGDGRARTTYYAPGDIEVVPQNASSYRIFPESRTVMLGAEAEEWLLEYDARNAWITSLTLPDSVIAGEPLAGTAHFQAIIPFNYRASITNDDPAVDEWDIAVNGSPAVTFTLETTPDTNLPRSVTLIGRSGRFVAVTNSFMLLPPLQEVFGHVVHGSNGLGDVIVTLTGAGITNHVTTDALGMYRFEGIPQGGYTITAARRGYAITPASTPVTVGFDPVEVAEITASLIGYPIDLGRFATFHDRWISFHPGNAGLFGGGITLEAWVNPDLINADRQNIIVLAAENGSGIRLSLAPVTGQPALQVYNVAAPVSHPDGITTITTPVSVPTGRWTHVTMAAGPASPGRMNVVFVLNGEIVHEATNVASPFFHSSIQYNASRIGRSGPLLNEPGEPAPEIFRGALDEVRIWSGHLGGPAIWDNLRGAPVITNGLVLRYDFNDADVSTQVPDRSGRTIHGTLSAARAPLNATIARTTGAPVEIHPAGFHVDRSRVSFVIAQSPSLGVITTNETSGAWSYTASVNAGGADSFGFIAGAGGPTQTVSVAVEARWLQDLSLSAATIEEGETIYGFLEISHPGNGALSVTLTSSSPRIILPTNFTVRAGFSFENFPVTAIDPGASNEVVTIFATANGQTVKTDLTLTALPAGRSITGRVTSLSSGGPPVSGATLTLASPGRTRSAVSDVDGFYAFAKVADGDYTLTVAKPGEDFADDTRLFTVDNDREENFVTLGASLVSLTISPDVIDTTTTAWLTVTVDRALSNPVTVNLTSNLDPFLYSGVLLMPSNAVIAAGETQAVVAVNVSASMGNLYPILITASLTRADASVQTLETTLRTIQSGGYVRGTGTLYGLATTERPSLRHIESGTTYPMQWADVNFVQAGLPAGTYEFVFASNIIDLLNAPAPFSVPANGSGGWFDLVMGRKAGGLAQGRYQRFTGAEVLRLPDTSSFDGEMTFEGWIRFFNAPADMVLLDLDAPSSSGRRGHDQLAFGLAPGDPGWGTQFWIQTTRSNDLYSYVLTQIPRMAQLVHGEWLHLALTLTPVSETESEARIYLFGDLCYTSVVARPASANRDHSLFGSSQGSSAGVINTRFRGAVDNLRLWSVARTPAQFRHGLFAAMPPDEPGLFADYRFNEVGGLIAPDATGEARDATFISNRFTTASSVAALSVSNPTAPVSIELAAYAMLPQPAPPSGERLPYFEIVDPPSDGMLTLNDARWGHAAYTPGGRFEDEDRFSFRVSVDGVARDAVTVRVVRAGTQAAFDAGYRRIERPVSITVPTNLAYRAGLSLDLSTNIVTTGARSVSVVSGGATMTGEVLFVQTAGPVVIAVSQPADELHEPVYVTHDLFIEPMPVAITLSNLNQVYDGLPKQVDAVTDPAGVGLQITYNGVANAPRFAGSYAVLAMSANPNYAGAATGTLVIAPATQSVVIASMPDVLVPVGSYVLEASSASGLPVTFSVVSGPARIENGNVLILTGSSGAVVLRAEQGGSANFAAGQGDLVFEAPPAVITGADVFTRERGRPWRIAASQLLANDVLVLSDQTMSVVSVSPVSAQGAEVSLNLNWVFYAPPAVDDQDDTFTYLVRISRGIEEPGQVTLQVIDPSDPADQEPILFELEVGETGIQAVFLGEPGQVWSIQAATGLVAQDWVEVQQLTIGPGGYAVFTDPITATGARIYRAVLLP